MHYHGTYFILCFGHLFLLQSKFEFINSAEISKKSKKVNIPVLTKKEPVEKVLIGDTTCTGLGKASWESIYNLLEVEDLEVIKEGKGIANSTDKIREYSQGLGLLFFPQNSFSRQNITLQ